MISGSVTSNRSESWALDQLGNWSNVNTLYTDPNEFDEAGVFNEANEQTSRGTNTGFAYDAVGNLTDDGANYRYVYDAY